MASKKKVKPTVRRAVAHKTHKKQKPASTLEIFLRALTELYPKDALAPGLSVAYLPAGKHTMQEGMYYHGNECHLDEAGGCYYVSVVRYEGGVLRNEAMHNAANYKQVLYHATGGTLKQAVADVVNQWLSATKAVQVLRSGKEL